MKTGDYIIEAMEKQAKGEVAVHKANIEVYKTMQLVLVNILILQKHYCRVRQIA